MSIAAMFVLFGIAVPALNVIASPLCGGQIEECKEIKREWMQDHLVQSTVGTVISLVPAIIYWGYVFTYIL